MAVFAREKYEMIEKQLILEDDSVIHYAEGPDNGPALLLLHGQQVSWEDYRSSSGIVKTISCVCGRLLRAWRFV